MELKKSFLALLLATTLLLALALSGCGGGNGGTAPNGSGSNDSNGAGTEIVELTFANVTSDSCKFSAETFKEIVEEETNGTVIVNLFNDNQLGDDRVVIEGTQMGEIDIAVSSTSSITTMYPDFYAFDAPFLFRDEAHAYESLDGEFGQQILSGMEEIGLRGLGFWENGMQAVANDSTPFATPEDMSGLKIRCMENEVYLAMFRAWGANPTPMAFGEIFTGLQQGQIDGVTTTLGAIDTNHFMDVQSYLTVMKYAYLPYFLCMNLDVYNSLTDDQRAAIDKAAAESITVNREKSQEIEADFLERCEAEDDITVTYLTEEQTAVLKQLVEEANVYDLVRNNMKHPEYFDNFIDGNS